MKKLLFLGLLLSGASVYAADSSAIGSVLLKTNEQRAGEIVNALEIMNLFIAQLDRYIKTRKMGTVGGVQEVVVATCKKQLCETVKKALMRDLEGLAS